METFFLSTPLQFSFFSKFSFPTPRKYELFPLLEFSALALIRILLLEPSQAADTFQKCEILVNFWL